MIKPTKLKVPYHLLTTALLSGILTLILSIIYSTLCVVALVVRGQCDKGSLENIDGAGYFMNTLYTVYIQKDECDYSLTWEDLTSSHSIFVMIVITLTASLLCLAASITLISVVSMEEGSQYLNLVVYAYVGACVASLVVDITLGTHFGMDLSLLSSQLAESNPGLHLNYTRDMVRMAALFLMTISLKGYVAHAINIVLLILLLVHIAEYQELLHKHEHSIHKLGALNAYDHPRRLDDNSWQHHPDMSIIFSRNGPQTNPAYITDDDSHHSRSPMREAPASDYSNRFYDRSESWQPGSMAGARPFSYLEEPKRASPAKSPTPTAGAADPWSRAHEPHWSRNQHAPPVPAPDYSPQGARRLKSALKPAYM